MLLVTILFRLFVFDNFFYNLNCPFVDPYSSFSCSFKQQFCKMIGWHTHCEVDAPHSNRDLPLLSIENCIVICQSLIQVGEAVRDQLICTRCI